MNKRTNSTEQIDELRRISLEHTWKWFEFQANQRMVLFRFYLLFVSIILAAIVTLITQDYLWVVASLSLIGAFISILFWLLDIRIKFLLNVGFDALKEDEEYIANVTGNRKIILKSHATGQSLTVSKLLMVLFLLSASSFVIVALVCTIIELGG